MPVEEVKAFKIPVAGAELEAFEYGNSQATERIILLHGGPALPVYIRSLGKLLAEATSLQILEYRQRGKLFSSSSEPITVERHLSDLDHIINRYAAHQKLFLVAHSFGALLTTLYLAGRPQAPLKKAFLISTSPFERKAQARFLHATIERLTATERAIRDPLFERLHSPQLSASQKIEGWNQYLKLVQPTYHFDRKAEEMVGEGYWDVEAAFQTLDSFKSSVEMHSRLTVKKLEQIDVPLAIFHGLYDPGPCAVLYQALARAKPEIPLILAPDCGHFPWAEPAYQKTFLEWITKGIQNAK